MSLTTLTISDLDSIRAEAMMAMLNEKGRKEIWKYDIIRRKDAQREALHAQDYDNIEAAGNNMDKPYALVGPSIGDSYFGTVAELISILVWVCFKALGEGYCVDTAETYSNQSAFLKEHASFPFIPVAK